ncbi:hypothetical protein HMPREF9999_02227 [Alloprevotella sp. oral taxon 473 str. F0040]|nr:hypothetical protein HMPREF9999_02227 [Alloprevotella sp. oral taxon 473 str. F0040]
MFPSLVPLLFLSLSFLFFLCILLLSATYYRSLSSSPSLSFLFLLSSPPSSFLPLSA